MFVPAAFLPGITGQLFRQFALVIAATAVISAINAVTLKPAQCALYLKPKKEGSRPNAFYRGFNKAYGSVEGFYVGIVSWMAHRVGLMLLVFFAVIAVAGWRFIQQPTGFLPTEDQGYCIIAKATRRRRTAAARAVADKINDIARTSRGRRLGDGRRSVDPRRRHPVDRLDDVRSVQGLERARRRTEPRPHRSEPAPEALAKSRRRGFSS